jgi:hypothetical protein
MPLTFASRRAPIPSAATALFQQRVEVDTAVIER